MALIQFVNNYEDLSTDKGYQFKFHCDKCGNGVMSRFQTSTLGMASSLLNAASNFLGWGHSAGNSAYEIQRAIGGKVHDTALQIAVEEGRQHFHQCSRCAKWVCPDACWNASANQCEDCAPDFEEEMASAHAQAKADAVRQQLYEKARATDYVANVDLSAKSSVAAPNFVKKAARQKTCAHCRHALGAAKFCPECGSSAAKSVAQACRDCGFKPATAARFCPECGGKMEVSGKYEASGVFERC